MTASEIAKAIGAEVRAEALAILHLTWGEPDGPISEAELDVFTTGMEAGFAATMKVLGRRGHLLP